MEKIYLDDLEELKKEADKISNTPMMSLGKVLMLVMLNMRYEKIMLDRNLKEHPYALTRGLILDSIKFLKIWSDVSFIENSAKNMNSRERITLEDGHKELFQKLWVNFDKKEYENRIERYIYRLKVNNLDDGWLKDFRCIDFGCGHGNFAHALIRQGAEYVYAIDYGENQLNMPLMPETAWESRKIKLNLNLNRYIKFPNRIIHLILRFKMEFFIILRMKMPRFVKPGVF
ncbi:MAG: hypothetical protein Q7J72_02930 [Candidatus Omnitrophota bacterium]|nr:hypothetical protein [Candidatus Omnitrophota bacterium]